MQKAKEVQEVSQVEQVVETGMFEGSGPYNPITKETPFITGWLCIHLDQDGIREESVEAIWQASYGMVITLRGGGQIQYNEQGIAYGKKSLQGVRGCIKPRYDSDTITTLKRERIESQKEVDKSESVLHQFAMALELAKANYDLAKTDYEENLALHSTR